MIPLRVALIGHGKMGEILARNIALHPGFEIATVCDSNPEVAKAVSSSEYSSAKFTAHADDIFNAPNIDVVVIATLPDSHYDLAKKALAAGKHVLVEKPISQNVGQAQELAMLAGTLKRTLMVDHTLLYEEAAQELQRQLASQQFGKPKEFEFTRLQPLCARLQHRHCFEEVAPHVFSVLDMLDNYLSRQAEISYLEGDLKSSVKARVKMESGLEGTINFAFRTNTVEQERRTSISLQKRLSQDHEVSHTASWDERRDPVTNEQQIIINDQAGEARLQIKTGKVLPLTAAIDDLHASITQHREPRSNGHTAIRVMQLMDAVAQSRASGRPATIDLAPVAITPPARISVRC